MANRAPMARGRAIELAVKRAAIEYRKQGRALLVQQYPRMATGSEGRVVYAGKAPIDFMGAIGDSAGAIECKEHAAKSFPVREFDEDQRTALDALEQYGFDVQVVIDMTAHGETYLVPWFQIACFIAAPWRKSLTLRWLRAFGQLCPAWDRNDPLRRCLFLDAAAHPEHERSLLEIWKEREVSPVIKLDDQDDTDFEVPPHNEYSGLTQEQIRERLRDAVNDGIGRQLKKQGQQRKWARKRGGSAA